jgi:hypothetical protein
VSPEAFPEAVYGGVGGALVASWKKDLKETKCCGLVVLPGVNTRLYMARKINEAIRRARRDALLDAAKDFDNGPSRVANVVNFASELRSKARAIRIRGDAT